MAATLRMIADRVGVSPQAVSYVLNDREAEMRISAQRSEEIRRVAKELNYVPNAVARAMKTRRTRQVGVLVRVIGEGAIVHPRALEMIMGINAGLEPSGNIVVIIPVVGDRESDQVESRIFRERMLDGIVLLSDVPEVDAERAIALIPSAIWTDTNSFTPRNCIRRDEIAVGRKVGSELHKLGYRKFIYVDKRYSDHFSSQDRKAGVEAIAAELRVSVERQVLGLVPHVIEQPDWARTVSRDTAVIASDGYVAKALQAIFSDAGLRPGIDFALACCDDADEFSWTWPGLSRVRFDRYAMGLRAAAMILDRIADPRRTVSSSQYAEEWIPGTTARPLTAE